MSPRTVGDTCLHCRSPISRSQKDPFCCRGCEFVYRSIHLFGLESFYQYAERSVPASEVFPEKSFDYLELEEVQDGCVRSLSQERKEISFYLPTMHCSACVWLLEKLPRLVRGIDSARVSFAEGTIAIIFDPGQLSLSRIGQVLNSFGYPPVPKTRQHIASQERQQNRSFLARIGVSAICAANTMMFADFLNSGSAAPIEEPFRTLFVWLNALLALPVVTYAAWPFYRSAIGSLIAGVLHLDVPISLAILLCYGADLSTALQGGTRTYFDSITCLVFLLLFARYIQRRAVFRARASTATTWDLLPMSALVCRQGVSKRIPTQELLPGDRVEVGAGQRFPSDGIVHSGTSTVEEAFLTGEALPREVSCGSLVSAGATNVEALLNIQVTKVGSESRLGKIIEQLKRAQEEKSSAQQKVDRMSEVFTWIVLAASIFTYLFWSMFDPVCAFDRVIALLIVSCPCALGLAIPAVAIVALGQAQRNSIYVRKCDALQQVSHSKRFYFDKTGTLTSGKARVTEYLGEENLFPFVAALAKQTPTHPLAQALIEYCCERGGVGELEQSRSIPGYGVEGKSSVGMISIGSIRWAQERGRGIPSDFQQKIDWWTREGSSVVLFEMEGVVRGAFRISDMISHGAREVIEGLRRDGKEVLLLSGDDSRSVQFIGGSLGISESCIFGDVSPEEKAKIVGSDLSQTVMIGDGLNDAPAMQQASVSIALHGGIETVFESADIFLSGMPMPLFQSLYEGSKKINRVILRNRLISFSYNVTSAVAAFFGYITPLEAAILMPLSSLTVVFSSVTPRYFLVCKE